MITAILLLAPYQEQSDLPSSTVGSGVFDGIEPLGAHWSPPIKSAAFESQGSHFTMTVYRSPFPSFSLKTSSLWSFLLGEETGVDWTRPAYVDALSGETLVREDVRVLSLQVAYALESRGVSEGDVAMIFR